MTNEAANDVNLKRANGGSGEEHKAQPEVINKKPKTESANNNTGPQQQTASNCLDSRRLEKGIAPIKSEYIIMEADNTIKYLDSVNADDAAEQADKADAVEETSNDAGKKGKKSKHKKRGQNKKRELAQPKDTIQLCTAFVDPEDNGQSCTYGDKCRRSHDVEAYLKSKQPDAEGVCPKFATTGICSEGIKCRWLSSHFDKSTGKLVKDEAKFKRFQESGDIELNKITYQQKLSLQKKNQFDFSRSDQFIDYLDQIVKYNSEFNNLTEKDREEKRMKESEVQSEALQEAKAGDQAPQQVEAPKEAEQQAETPKGTKQQPHAAETQEAQKELEAQPTNGDDNTPIVVLASNPSKSTVSARQNNQFDYIEAPFKPWEKKKLNYDKAKVVSPLTTVGNLPYRRLMKSLYNVDVTFSEMALSLPLLQGHNSEWALMKAHSSEYPGFGAQIAASKHWQAVKAAHAISEIAPNVSEINLNCGCPIDLLYKQGAGSGLLEQPAKTLRMLKGMNHVSKDIPITVKIRMGTRDDSPNADNLVRKILNEGGPDVQAITLHGRSRQQRYTKTADWDYISKIGKIVQDFNEAHEDKKDAYDMPNKKIYFVGNGDCYNFVDWYKATDDPNIDTVMVARGALIKPWLFEEIEAQQYLDKSATERLEVIKRYAEYAINHWGSDEYGVSLARRFLCEWLSFTYRYIPVGILERLPNQLNERPPKWKGRNELETLLGSGDYKDWIKISEMFLGPAHPNFNFIPKHKSNAY